MYFSFSRETFFPIKKLEITLPRQSYPFESALLAPPSAALIFRRAPRVLALPGVPFVYSVFDTSKGEGCSRDLLSGFPSVSPTYPYDVDYKKKLKGIPPP